ncbi:MAG TPA: hypothetical protein ENI31_04460 [Candidatus Omnitrophica bacterium]|nr:hypothetical protein [Candidatus Omnitrophota bacterium]
MGRKIKSDLNKKGVILLGVVLVITAVSIYLGGYALWAIYDQRNLMREQKADKAENIALAGLERAKANLFLDDNWIDGNINDTSVTPPDPSNPDNFYELYPETSLGEGSYKVEIDYLQRPKSCTSGCEFYSQRILVRSTGYLPDEASYEAKKVLEEIVSWYKIKNLTQDKFYSMLQLAVDGANSGDKLGITEVELIEDIIIDKNLEIKGCYDVDFNFRNCMDYRTRISGNVTISSSAQVTMGGLIIE